MFYYATKHAIIDIKPYKYGLYVAISDKRNRANITMPVKRDLLEFLSCVSSGGDFVQGRSVLAVRRYSNRFNCFEIFNPSKKLVSLCVTQKCLRDIIKVIHERLEWRYY